MTFKNRYNYIAKIYKIDDKFFVSVYNQIGLSKSHQYRVYNDEDGCNSLETARKLGTAKAKEDAYSTTSLYPGKRLPLIEMPLDVKIDFEYIWF